MSRSIFFIFWLCLNSLAWFTSQNNPSLFYMESWCRPSVHSLSLLITLLEMFNVIYPWLEQDLCQEIKKNTIDPLQDELSFQVISWVQLPVSKTDNASVMIFLLTQSCNTNSCWVKQICGVSVLQKQEESLDKHVVMLTFFLIHFCILWWELKV